MLLDARMQLELVGRVASPAALRGVVEELDCMQQIGVRGCLHRREEDKVPVSVLDDVEALLTKQDPFLSCVVLKLQISDEAEVCDAVDAHSGVCFAQSHCDVTSGPEQVGTMLGVIRVEGGSLRGVRLIRGEVIPLHSKLRTGVCAVQCNNHGILLFLVLVHGRYDAEADVQVVQGPPI